jgi:hypothetical protein
MTKPERLVGALLALAAVLALGASIKGSELGGAAFSFLAAPERIPQLFALLALSGGSLVLGLALTLVMPLGRTHRPVAGFRPADPMAGGLAPAPAKFRPPLPGRYGKVTSRPPERHFAELPRPGFSKPMIVHKIYPQAPVVTRLDQAHLYWAMRLLSEKRGRDLKPRPSAPVPRKKALAGKPARIPTGMRARLKAKTRPGPL